MGRIAGRFARVEPRRRAREFAFMLPSDLPHRNCWTLAEYVGDSTPYVLQHLLLRAKRDADAIRDDLRGFVVEQLRDNNVVLVVDETGNVKKSIATVGMQRQYTGTAGRIETARSPSTSPARCRAYGGNPQLRGRWKPAGAATSSRLPVIISSPPGRGSRGPMSWSRSLRNEPGRSSPQESAPGGIASTTGPWPTSATTGPASAAYSSAATAAAVNSPSNAATQPGGSPWPGWCASPGADGRSRKPCRLQSVWPDWTNARPDAGPPGTAGPPSPCSPKPSWPQPPQTNAPTTRLRTS